MPINIICFRDCPRNGWGSNIFKSHALPFLGKKVKRINGIPRKSQEMPGQSRDSPGIIPGQSHAFSCLLIFLALTFVSLREGFGVGFRWVVGGGLPVGNEGEGDRGGEDAGVGWGYRSKKPASQCARVWQN